MPFRSPARAGVRREGLAHARSTVRSSGRKAAMEVPYLRLGVNVDHVATVRNARGGHHPDPVRAAHLAILAGADGITAHLREDRRHIRDDDMERHKREIITPLNFEMAATGEMTAIATRLRPHAAGGHTNLRPVVRQLREASTRVSLFVEPEVAAMQAACDLGAPVVELHTGTYCEAAEADDDDRITHELNRLLRAAEHGAGIGLEIHAGHGLNLDSVRPVAAIPQIVDLSIGHFLVGEALFMGFNEAVRCMRQAMDEGRARAGPSADRPPSKAPP